VSRTVGRHTASGVGLQQLQNSTTGLVTNPAVQADVRGLSVVVTGSDGHRAVISMGELDPGFGHQPDLAAHRDGAPLTTSGFARVVVPNDIEAGRFVSNLIHVEVFSDTTP
jgi:hypothetical protein